VIRFFKQHIYSLVICFAVWLGGLVWFIEQIPSPSMLTPPPKDAIVVLTGGAGRLEHGMEMLAERKGKVLFISGVSKQATLQDLLAFAPNAISATIKDMPIILGHEAQNTIGNARETAAWLRKEGYRDIYLVTSNYHMPRSLVEMREVAPDLQFTPAPVFPDDFTIAGWWSDKQSRSLIMLEYHKYLLARLRHWFVSAVRSNT
jgi:uncharacterized SAM-binding protein YcdF (DUF218 family)